jgi:branched-chain amino acid transport system ATP-binding protein
MFKVKNLQVKYGVIEAVRGVNLEIKKGEIVTLIGSNGAGKTSTLNGIMNLVKKDGIVEFLGEDISKLSTQKIVKKGISLVPEGRKVFVNLSVDENLEMGGFYNKDEGLKDDIYNLFPRLKDKKTQLAGTLSGGEQQMLAIGRALMSKPKLLILDEPSLGLAPKIVLDMFRVIERLKDEGITTLLVEQNAYIALKISDFAYVIENAEIVLSDKSSNLLKSNDIITKYLGG